MRWKKEMALCLAGVLAFSAAALGSMQNVAAAESAEVAADTESEVSASLEQIDMTKWQYNEDDDVYYQIGISYCSDPADASYETLAVFVPGAYMSGTKNEDGTYTCVLNEDGEINGYTAETAPIVMPINTPGYSAQKALTEYTNVSDYTDAGFVYVHAGCRGRDSGAPAGVTDLKAAIRYIRWCDDLLAGDAESIFTFGMSGGGAQSAIVGSAGDSELYDAYLAEIGAVEGVSDAVLGSMCWCPITNLDSADAAYEWMMGSTRSGLTEEEQAISDALAEAFADYINTAGLQDEDGNVLTLEASEDGIYQAGSYYEYLKDVIEESLNNFLADTEFPYDASSSGRTGGPDGMGPGSGFAGGGRPEEGEDGEGPGGDFQGKGAPGSGRKTERISEAGEEAGSAEDGTKQSVEEMDDISRTLSENGISLSGTYDTAEEYIAALNADGEWVSYDADTGTASITSIEAFVKAFKSASKSLGAFDQLDEGQGENELFGSGDGSSAHFDAALAAILESLGNEAAADYEEDLTQTDSVGNSAEIRLAMYTPLYYLLESSEGYGTSSVARYWRIRTGIAQSDTALTTEVDLALALENYDGVEEVDFETIWGEGHSQAEQSGDAASNFIAWVNACME